MATRESSEIESRVRRPSSSSWPRQRPRPTRRRMRWRACACARWSTRSPTIARRGGFWATCRHEGGWATPFAVQQAQGRARDTIRFSAGCRRTGCRTSIAASCLRRATRPEKDSLAPRRRGRRLRADWNPPWKITTEHFEIQTNVTLAEAISFGRRLEAFHDLFMALLADILGENLPLVRRFKDPSLTGEPAYKPHSVYYFGSKSEYVDYLSPSQGPEIAESLGFYDPPKSGGNRRMPAYFFRDPRRPVPGDGHALSRGVAPATLRDGRRQRLHQECGQLLGLRGTGHLLRDRLAPADGSLEVGGLVGRRIEEAIRALVGPANDRSRWPSSSRSTRTRSTASDEIYLHYQQAMALTVFLMQWHDGNVPRRIPRLRSRRLPRADQARHGPIAARSPRPAVLDPRQPSFSSSSRTARSTRAARRPWLSQARTTPSGPSTGAIRTIPHGSAPGPVQPPRPTRRCVATHSPTYGMQRHEPRTLDGRAGGSLKRRTASAALAGKHLVLVGAQLLEQADVFVIDIGRSRATIPGAKPAAILTVASKLLPRHKPDFL